MCDEVDLARGVRVQRITKIKVTSSLSWQTTGNAVDRYFAWFSGIYTSNVLCTHFSTVLGSETVGGAIANQNNLVGFAFAEKGTTTLDDFKQFLDENDVFIWAALATPVETALSAAEISAYKALTTYAPTTVITAGGGAWLTASYQQSILPSNAPAALLTASPANLYEAQLSAKVGNRVQRSKRVTYGYRSVRFDKDTGFYLNGVPTKLKGVCVHHDGGCIGAAENRSAIERQVDILTNMGCNAIRLTHNPFGAEYLDVWPAQGRAAGGRAIRRVDEEQETEGFRAILHRPLQRSRDQHDSPRLEQSGGHYVVAGQRSAHEFDAWRLFIQRDCERLHDGEQRGESPRRNPPDDDGQQRARRQSICADGYR